MMPISYKESIGLIAFKGGRVMQSMKKSVVIAGIILLFLAGFGLAQMGDKSSAGETRVVEGIKAVFKVTPSMSMVDLLLSYADTGKVITNAKVYASVKGPDGKVQEKDLMGMKMGKEYSFGNTIDFSKKGIYAFDISVEIDKKKERFNFSYEIR